MRILICTCEYPPWSGGIATFCHSLARGLAACGTEPIVLAPSYKENEKSPSFSEEAGSLGAAQGCEVPGRDSADGPAWSGDDGQVRVVRTPPGAERSPAFSRFLARAVSRYAPDVLLLGNEKAQRQAWRLGAFPVPVAIYLHGSQLLNPCGNGATGHAQADRLFDRTDWLMANSQSTADLLRQHSPTHGDRAHVVHLGIDVERLQPLPSPKLDVERSRWLPHQCKMVLCAARLSPDKGQDVLLKAFAAVRRQLPDTILHVAGDGPCRDDLHALAHHLALTNHVRFLGDLKPDELSGQLQLCDVFAMISRQESFGLVYLEANQFGKPVVAGRTGGVPEAVLNGRTGYLVDPNSVDETADAICRLLQDPARAAAMGEAGRQRVLDEFTHVHMAERMLALFSTSPARRPSRLKCTFWAARKLGQYYGRAAWEKAFGRRGMRDQLANKSETRSTKYETNPKSET